MAGRTDSAAAAEAPRRGRPWPARIAAPFTAALLVACALLVLAGPAPALYLEPGRAKYQRRLSQVVVSRLKQYGLDGRGSASAAAPAGP